MHRQRPYIQGTKLLLNLHLAAYRSPKNRSNSDAHLGCFIDLIRSAGDYLYIWPCHCQEQFDRISHIFDKKRTTSAFIAAYNTSACRRISNRCKKSIDYNRKPSDANPLPHHPRDGDTTTPNTSINTNLAVIRATAQITQRPSFRLPLPDPAVTSYPVGDAASTPAVSKVTSTGTGRLTVLNTGDRF